MVNELPTQLDFQTQRHTCRPRSGAATSCAWQSSVKTARKSKGSEYRGREEQERNEMKCEFNPVNIGPLLQTHL